MAPKKGTPKVVWMRNDGLVRIVHRPYIWRQGARSEFVVESKTQDSLGVEGWVLVGWDMGGGPNLEAFALALFGAPLPEDDGMSGTLL